MCFAWFNILHHHWKTFTLKHRYMSNIYCHKITNRFSNTHLLMYGLTYDEKKVVIFIAGHYVSSECISNSNNFFHFMFLPHGDFMCNAMFIFFNCCIRLNYDLQAFENAFRLISIRWIRSMLVLSIYRTCIGSSMVSRSSITAFERDQQFQIKPNCIGNYIFLEIYGHGIVILDMGDLWRDLSPQYQYN